MNISSIPYRYYRTLIYPKIKNFRGATRLKKFLFKISHLGLEKHNDDPQGIFEREDWDNLIILDACRHDVYTEVFGECGSRISLGSHSAEFLKKNFSEGEFDDIVYINANIHFSDPKMEEHIGRKDIFHEKFDTVMKDWDYEVGVTMPEKVTKDAITAEKLFPEKKKIIHYLQPHRKFVGSELEERGHPYERAEIGREKKSDVIEAYRKNLEMLQKISRN
jgi:hypothetical protein